eukprot:TRINITY_DN20_c0_g2_i1.p1 TRINITY_DN20_c0_g2~~TRINITY_DN20_c0_g2_i1.p1  ORF type:complete len:504 (-),score=122.40 TRINITY_DN20_c0_g2_i1:955-2466(-)
MSSLVGGMVLVAAVAVAVYGVVKLQYVRLANRISDLSEELAQAKQAVAVQRDADPDEAAISALTGGLQQITETLLAVANSTAPVTTEQASVLRDAIKVLLNRDFNVVQPRTKLNDDQEQFIMDCGMGVGTQNGTRHASRPLSIALLQSSNDETTVGLEHLYSGTPQVDVDTWDFDVFQVVELPERGVISGVVWAVLQDAQLFRAFSLHEPKLHHFLSLLDASYCGVNDEDKDDSAHENPYHNRKHAADVIQAMHFLLSEVLASSPHMRAAVTPLDRLACVLACAMHDYKHPGRNNVFLRNSLHRTHVEFFESALERFHAARGCSLLLLDPECQALANLTRAEQVELHATVCKLVLATDMAKHVEYLDAFKAWAAVQQRASAAGVAVDIVPGDPVTEVDDNSKLLVLQVLIKAADLSNAFRGWRVCHEWTMRVADEFRQQGAQELELGLSVSKFMDGRVSPQEMQNTFVPLIVVPLLRALDSLFPRLHFLEDIAWSNLEHWRSM